MVCPVKPGDAPPTDLTYRNVMRISIGGHGLRVQLSNEFNSAPLTVGSAHVAVDTGGGYIKSGSDRALTFSSRSSVVIPAGGFMVSDEVAMEVAPLSRLAVTLYLPRQTLSFRTCHAFAASTNFVAGGNQAGAARMTNAHPVDSWNFVKGVEVRADAGAFSIVALGDSITDGFRSTKDANRRWTDDFAHRLQSAGRTQIAVLNQGIGGNCVLRDDVGQSAIARFDRDVLAQSGVRYLVLLEGINDIDRTPAEIATPADLIAALSQLIVRAHAHSIVVFAATITPSAGEEGSSAQGEQVRSAVNNWIRTSGVPDGVIDFDKTLRSTSRPSALRSVYDSGDHIHPNNFGYQVMADAVDIARFR